MVRKTRTIALAALIALLAAGAVHALPASSRPALPETRTVGFVDALRHWFTSLLFRGPLTAVWGQEGGVMDPNGGVTSVTGKEGSDMDPDGSQTFAGSQMDPNGGDEGSQMDPNG